MISEVLNQHLIFFPQDDEYLDDKDSDLTAAKNLTHLSISVKNDIISRFGIHATGTQPQQTGFGTHP